MKKSPNILTPIPTFHLPPSLAAAPKPSTDDKLFQLDKHETSATLQMLHSTQFQASTGRRNSAFSIYENLSPSWSHVEQPSCNSSERLGSNGQVEKPKRSWKREKKGKRELNRLETKNLNRYFRSKINQLLRDVKENPASQEEKAKAQQVLEILNRSNKIMFSQIREIVSDKWLQQKLTSCSAGLLRYVHAGKMGMQSKLIMLKYFNKILNAIRNPPSFNCWK